MTAILPARSYLLACAAWIPTLVIWHADGRFTRVEGAPCDEYAAALAASWRLWSVRYHPWCWVRRAQVIAGR